MGSGAVDGARDRRALLPRRRARRRAAGAALPPVPDGAAARGAAGERCTASPCSTARRSRAPAGEPLYLDVVAALAEAYARGERPSLPLVIGGRYGLSSKEFTPAMVAGRLRRARTRRAAARTSPSASSTTSRSTSLDYDPDLDIEPAATVRAVFYGLGSDGTVGANKNTIKIIGEDAGLTRRATSSTTRRSPARRPSRTCASARSRSARPT